jgi:radical SAM superfamily enzyme YgiQ (UPF0313 family)
VTIYRILFVRPRYRYEPVIAPPLGPMYLSAYLKKVFPDDVDVKLIDRQLDLADESELLRQIEAYGPDIIGFSALGSQGKEVESLSALTRSRFPGVPQIVGGPYASADGKRILDRASFDFVVRGEGELIICSLVDALMNSKPLAEVKGLTYQENGDVIRTPERPLIDPLDSLPLPDFDLVDIPDYWNHPRSGYVYRNKAYFNIFTSRGCPYTCYYCHNQFGKKFRWRSPEHVTEELKILYQDHHVREIHIIDDSFNIIRSRAEAIFQGIIEHCPGLAIAFSNGIRGDLLDEDFVDLMKKAGVFRTCIAIETAVPRLQRECEKNLDIQKAKRAIELLVSKKIITHVFIMLGFATETEEEMRTSADFPRSTRCHSTSFFMLRPFPGTKVYEIFTRMSGATPVDQSSISFYYKDDDEFSISEVPSKKMGKIIRDAVTQFYANPMRLYRIWRDVSPKSQLFNLAVRIFKSYFRR